MVICLERGADLHMAQLLPHCHSLSLASVKSRLVLPFWYRLTRVVLDKGPLNECVCVCVLFICISCTVLFVSISRVIGCEDRLRNDLYCVGWGVKLYSNQPTSVTCKATDDVLEVGRMSVKMRTPTLAIVHQLSRFLNTQRLHHRNNKQHHSAASFSRFTPATANGHGKPQQLT